MLNKDENLLSAIRSLSGLSKLPDLESALTELLTKFSGEHPMTIKGVRDKFSKVNSLAKSGQIQLVKGPPGEETVIVSIKTLAAMFKAAAGTFSFADALSAVGFQPTGQHLEQTEGFHKDNVFVLEPQAEEQEARVQHVAAQHS